MKLLNVVAEDSWVGWDSFKSEMFFTSIPCTQDLLISPPIFPENGFDKYEESKSDFSIFLKDPSQTKKKLRRII